MRVTHLHSHNVRTSPSRICLYQHLKCSIFLSFLCQGTHDCCVSSNSLQWLKMTSCRKYSDATSPFFIFPYLLTVHGLNNTCFIFRILALFLIFCSCDSLLSQHDFKCFSSQVIAYVCSLSTDDLHSVFALWIFTCLLLYSTILMWWPSF